MIFSIIVSLELTGTVIHYVTSCVARAELTIVVFLIRKLCGAVGGYQCFGGIIVIIYYKGSIFRVAVQKDF
jgi:hypothetical protein